jgi:hypothetical protein
VGESRFGLNQGRERGVNHESLPKLRCAAPSSSSWLSRPPARRFLLRTWPGRRAQRSSRTCSHCPCQALPRMRPEDLQCRIFGETRPNKGGKCANAGRRRLSPRGDIQNRNLYIAFLSLNKSGFIFSTALKCTSFSWNLRGGRRGGRLKQNQV